MPRLLHPELLPVVLIGAGHPLAHPAQDRVAGEVHLLVAVGEHLPPREHQERAEQVQDPGEVVDEHRAAGDEDRPEYQGTEYAVEQHAVLVLPGDGEVGEDQREHEDVVDRQRLLDQVAGVVLAAGPGAVRPPHHAAEGEPQTDPDGRPDRGLLDRDDMGGAVGEQVDSQHRENDGQHRGPRPQGDIHCRYLQRARTRRAVGGLPHRAVPTLAADAPDRAGPAELTVSS